MIRKNIKNLQRSLLFSQTSFRLASTQTYTIGRLIGNNNQSSNDSSSSFNWFKIILPIISYMGFQTFYGRKNKLFCSQAEENMTEPAPGNLNSLYSTKITLQNEGYVGIKYIKNKKKCRIELEIDGKDIDHFQFHNAVFKAFNREKGRVNARMKDKTRSGSEDSDNITYTLNYVYPLPVVYGIKKEITNSITLEFTKGTQNQADKLKLILEKNHDHFSGLECEMIRSLYNLAIEKNYKSAANPVYLLNERERTQRTPPQPWESFIPRNSNEFMNDNTIPNNCNKNTHTGMPGMTKRKGGNIERQNISVVYSNRRDSKNPKGVFEVRVKRNDQPEAKFRVQGDSLHSSNQSFNHMFEEMKKEMEDAFGEEFSPFQTNPFSNRHRFPHFGSGIDPFDNLPKSFQDFFFDEKDFSNPHHKGQDHSMLPNHPDYQNQPQKRDMCSELEKLGCTVFAPGRQNTKELQWVFW